VFFVYLFTLSACFPLNLKKPSEIPISKELSTAFPKNSFSKTRLEDRVTYHKGKVSCDLRGDNLQEVLSVLSKKTGKNILFSEQIYFKISAHLKDISLDSIFDILCKESPYKIERHPDYYLVKLPEKGDKNPIVTKVINLRFVDSDELMHTLMDSFMPTLIQNNRRRIPRTSFMLDIETEVEENIEERTEENSDSGNEKALLENKVTKKQIVEKSEKRNKERVFKKEENSNKHLKKVNAQKRITKRNKKKKTATRISRGVGNSIIIVGRRSKVNEISDWIMRMDKNVPQVYFETEIIEFNILALKNMGINIIDYINGINGVSINSTLNLKPISNSAIDLFTLKTSAQAKLDFLMENSHAKIVGHPSIKISSGKKAKIAFKEKRFVQIKALQAAELKEVEAGLSLAITPKVTADGSIIVKIVISQSLFLPEVTGDILVSTSISEASTELRVRSGEVIVIGGIITERNTKTTSGIPYLKNLPILGYLFGKSNIQTERIETIFKITPRLINFPSAHPNFQSKEYGIGGNFL